MRPRNVLTQTNDMRRLMGLPLLNENTGETIKDVKKKVLTEDRGFSLGFANPGGLTIAEEDIDETTEAEEVEDKGVGAPINDVVEEQEDYGEGPEGEETGIDVDNADITGDGEEPLDQVVAEDDESFGYINREYDTLNGKIDYYEDPMEENLTEGGSFAKYNITLED